MFSIIEGATATMIKNDVATQITNSDGSPFFAVPANAGPGTMNYAPLFSAATYTNLNVRGLSVFAGTTGILSSSTWAAPLIPLISARYERGFRRVDRARGGSPHSPRPPKRTIDLCPETHIITEPQDGGRS